MEIVTVKGFGSGLGALLIAVCVGSEFPSLQHIAIILLLGFSQKQSCCLDGDGNGLKIVELLFSI